MLKTYLGRGSKESSLRQENQPVGGEGSSATHDKYYEFEEISATDSDATQDSSCSETDDEKDDETDDSDNSDMDLSNDEPKEDDNAAGFGVFMYNKSIKPLESTYLSPTVTCSSLEYIQSLLNEPYANELTDFMSNLVYIDAHTTSKVANLNGNHELEALTSINVSEVIDKAVHAKVLTEMKKLLPTHVLNSIANYVKPRLNNSVCKVMDIQENDKNRSQNDKTEHENGKSMKEMSKLKPSQKVKVNPRKWIWKEHRKPNSKT
ncbi:hypothetical protein Tco_0844485 [Tanacetum coccineum]